MKPPSPILSFNLRNLCSGAHDFPNCRGKRWLAISVEMLTTYQIYTPIFLCSRRRPSILTSRDRIKYLYEDQVQGLFENMKQTKRQAFSIHNGESTGTGRELHVNRKNFVEWTKIVRENFDIASAIQITPEQVLYLTQSKPK